MFCGDRKITNTAIGRIVHGTWQLSITGIVSGDAQRVPLPSTALGQSVLEGNPRTAPKKLSLDSGRCGDADPCRKKRTRARDTPC